MENRTSHLELNRTHSILFLLVFAFIAYANQSQSSLAIVNATIFNVHTKSIEANKTILIKDGIIVALVDSTPVDETEYQLLDVKHNLVTPGFIDVHHHSMELFPGPLSSGGAIEPKLSMHPDSIAKYRKIFANAYLPFGVTTVREEGNSENYIPMMQAWMHRDSSAPDFFPSGGALCSYEKNRKPYIGHAIIKDSSDAAERVQRYYNLGFRNIKLYWRLRPTEFDAAIKKVFELNMNVSAHIADGKITSIRHGISVGLKDIEHAYTLGEEVLSKAEMDSIYDYHFRNTFWFIKPKGAFYLSVMDLFNLIGTNNSQMIALINEMQNNHVSVTPTLHIFAQRLHLTYFTSKPIADFDNSEHYSKKQLKKAQEGYSILASYVKRMFDQGVQLNMGTDCQEPGKAALSELLLLHDLGIPMPDVLCIGTINGAKAIGKEEIYGSIEKGKQANLIIFSKSPLDTPVNLLGERIVIKDGQIWNK